MSASFARRKRKNRLMFGLTAVCALVAFSALFFILGYIVYQGCSALSLDFLLNLPKPVGEQGGGIANAIVGSLKIVALAGAVAAPVGVLAAVYLVEYGSQRAAFIVRYSADLLNGMPSIVIGIFIYTLLVLPMKGFSALAGSAALAMIMIPIVLRNTEEIIRLVPASLREAGLALGLPRWKVIVRIVLPTAAGGIVTGILLAISRIAGETAPLIFTAFGNRFWDSGMFSPMAALPLTIYTYAISPYPDWHRQAWAAALILMLVVLVGNIMARLLLRRCYGAAR
ncbi:MAG: phosphate ABC transporter permease PstA [Elusimicrobiota bacterium]